MSQLKVLLLIVLLVALVAAAGAAIFLGVKQPNMRPAPELRVELTAENVERGRYLAQNVSDCLGCHSDHHADRFGFPVKPGTEGAGGYVFSKGEGVPGRVAAQNITPDKGTGIGDWSDGEIVRAIREGVRRDGSPLFPMMPYPDYHSMSDDDVKAIVAYLRTLPARQNKAPLRELDFPVNVLVKFMPKPVDGVIPSPPAADPVARGRYLATIAGCRNCHTPRDGKGRPLMDQAFSGGWEMVGPWGRVVTANITPHASTFVGQRSREQFIARFKAYAGFTADSAPPAQPGMNTVMPWLAFAGMTDEDLGAIYDYLRTLPAVDKRIVTFPDAAPASK
ncbi:MAG: cytochrome c [Thermoanaerobaculia bacterium]|nr:cytochrome c [Thermoanaerobaculia bacterium]